MDDLRTQGAGASLTQSVCQFRRVARLAAADPLRLLLLDPLAQLASLSAPITALIDAAPFERLRDAVAAPPSARRGNAARARLQPLAGGNAAVRARPAVDTAPPLSQVGAGNAERAPAAQQAASLRTAARLSSPTDPLAREVAPMATLAERRAALRRGTAEPDSRSRPAAPPLEPAEARAGGLPRPSNVPEIGISGARQHSREPLADREDARATTRALLAAQEMRRPGDEPLPTDGQEVVPQHDDASAPAGFAPVEMPLVDDTPQPAARGPRGDRETAAASERRSVHLAGLSPNVARAMAQADTNAGRGRRAPGPTSESELADALFEVLYRDGVDVSWP